MISLAKTLPSEVIPVRLTLFAQGDRSWEGVLYIIPEEDSHPERRVEVYRHTRSRMGITLVGLYKDDFTCKDFTF